MAGKRETFPSNVSPFGGPRFVHRPSSSDPRKADAFVHSIAQSHVEAALLPRGARDKRRLG